MHKSLETWTESEATQKAGAGLEVGRTVASISCAAKRVLCSVYYQFILQNAPSLPKLYVT